MPLALLLPATLLGYLAGIVALVLGLGWLACLGVVVLTGLGTVFGVGIVLTVRSGLPARAPSSTRSARAPS